MKHLGQHFLKKRSVAKKIVAALELAPGDTVIEIGPGHGELTEVVERESWSVNRGIKIIGVEKDHELADQLRKKFAEDKNIEIIEGDAIRILPELCSAFHASRSTIQAPRFPLHASRFKIVGNIPYYITGHLLRTIGELEVRPVLCVLMVQEEVAERIAATPPPMNSLAASVQFWAEPTIILRVPSSDFAPPPDVDSAVVKLETWSVQRETPEKEYYKAVKVLFQQPRKTVLNNLVAGSEANKNSLSKNCSKS